MKSTLRILGYTAVLGLVLLAACSLPGGCSKTGTSTGTPPTAPPVDQPVSSAIIDIPAGQIIHWFDGSDFVYIEPSKYQMGTMDPAGGDAVPAHLVDLSGYWIQLTEVTNRQYSLCLVSGACPMTASNEAFTDPNQDSHPVTGVNYGAAQAYCTWIAGRLPTEAEWEFAGRGPLRYPYPWGTDEPNCALADYNGCLNPGVTRPVGSYPAGLSPFGLSDMTGNVYEWVADWYAADYYANSPAENPAGPATGEKRVLRGSSYLTAADSLALTLRGSLEPDQNQTDLGFRCVLNPESLAGAGGAFAPVCTAPQYTPVQQDANQPPLQLHTLPGFKLETHCAVDGNNNQNGTGTVILDAGVDPNSVNIESENGGITCVQDIVDPQKFNCSGDGFTPGADAIIEVCPKAPAQLPTADPTCPLDYSFDPVSNLCKYAGPNPVQCALPNVNVPGYGCLDAPVGGQCLPGQFPADYQGNPVCVPIVPNCPPEGCPLVCPQGLNLDPSQGCCGYTPDVAPICPLHYHFDDFLKQCTPDNPPQPICSGQTVHVPTCALDACLITTTTIVPGGAAGGPVPITTTSCVSPCPPNTPNGGFCVP